jgi:transitional endoplasmic reticulum ATPase
MPDLLDEDADTVSGYADEIWRGQLARITHVADDATFLAFEYASGESGYATGEDTSRFTTGDIVLIDPDTDLIKSVPAELWRQSRWVGVVRHRDAEHTLVEVSGLLKPVPTSDVTYGPGATVLATEDEGVLQVVSDTPIRPSSRSGDDEALSIDHFKPEPGEFTFDDFGGLDEVVSRAKELIELQLEKREMLGEIGVRPIKGVLFTGPPGTGKTMLASIVARESGAAFYLVSGPQIMSKWFGESEALLRKLFEDAAEQERSIIFFDEIDSVAGEREGAHEASARVVATFLTEMDGFERDQNIVVIAATNRPDDLDPALRRPGRFDWEINFPEPDEEDRMAILEASGRGLRKADDLPLEKIAAETDGWSSAALAAVWTEAGLLAVDDYSRTTILIEDFLGGVDRVRRQLKVSRPKARVQVGEQ